MSTMFSRVADRVRTAYLMKSRAYKAYKQAVKDSKDVKEMENDPLFVQLRTDLQVAKDNLASAQQSYDAVHAFPPAN